MNQDDPGRRAGRRLFETAYTRSPYRFTVIGYPDIFNELKPRGHPRLLPREIRAQQRLLRRGGRCEARRGGRARSARPTPRAKARPLPPVVLPEEPKQTAPREIIEEAPIELGHFHFAWHIPDLRHPGRAGARCAGRAARAAAAARASTRQVREKQGLVHSVDAWTYSPGEPGLFGMSAMVDAGQVRRRARRHAGRSREDEGRPRSPRTNWARR